MKQLFEAQRIDGIKYPKYEVEVVCFHCQDPVSQAEETSGVCTNCGEAWRPKVSVAIWATSLPAAGTQLWG
jgi:hypothetical protein